MLMKKLFELSEQAMNSTIPTWQQAIQILFAGLEDDLMLGAEGS